MASQRESRCATCSPGAGTASIFSQRMSVSTIRPDEERGLSDCRSRGQHSARQPEIDRTQRRQAQLGLGRILLRGDADGRNCSAQDGPKAPHADAARSASVRPRRPHDLPVAAWHQCRDNLRDAVRGRPRMRSASRPAASRKARAPECGRAAASGEHRRRAIAFTSRRVPRPSAIPPSIASSAMVGTSAARSDRAATIDPAGQNFGRQATPRLFIWARPSRSRALSVRTSHYRRDPDGQRRALEMAWFGLGIGIVRSSLQRAA